MPSSVAFSAVAIGQATAAQLEAARAKRIACEAMMPAYKHEGATLEQARQYAECVGVLYPAEMTDGQITAAKAVVALVLIGVVVGAIKGWKDDGEAMTAVLFALMGGVGVVIAIIFLGAFISALEFLVS